MNEIILKQNINNNFYNLQSEVLKVFDNLDISQTTKIDYQYRIGMFVNHIERVGFNNNTFLEFKKILEQKNDMSVSTKNKYLATARILVKEFHRCGLLPVDISLNIKSFKQSKKHKLCGLKQAEIDTLIAKLHNLSYTPKHTRLRALFCLLAFQGLRQIEIIRLNVSDIDLINYTANIQGKGMDDKELVYLAPQTVKTIREYIKISKIRSGALFQSLGNRKRERLTTMTIKRELNDLMKSVGIKKTVHGFRHYFITKLLEELDVRDARKFSRHNSLEMLIVYDDEMDLKTKSAQVFKCFEGLNIL